MRYYRVEIYHRTETGAVEYLDTQHYAPGPDTAMASVVAEERIAAERIERWRVTEAKGPRDGRREVLR